jgi:hypothetical protein
MNSKLNRISKYIGIYDELKVKIVLESEMKIKVVIVNEYK